MSEFVDRNDQKQRRYAIRAESVTFLDAPLTGTQDNQDAGSGTRNDERRGD